MGKMFSGGSKDIQAQTMAAQQAAQQQQAANRDTAIAGTEMSMVNQVGPYGSLAYRQTGTSANGNPLWTATQSFDPVTQRTLDAEKLLDLKTNRLAVSQADRAARLLSSNADLSDAAIRAKTDLMINPRLGDRFGKDEASLRSSLMARGLREGSEAFNDEMLSFRQGVNDAYTQEGLANRQQAIQELLLPRNQVLNEIASLGSMQQIAGPQFVSTPQTNVQAANFQSVGDATIQAMRQADQRKQAAYGGIFGLVGNMLGTAQQGAKMAVGMK